MEQDRQHQITNRHIAKLLTRLQPLNIPEIAVSEIKRQMWFLSEDLCENKEQVNGQSSN